jgi:hypothetical protein
MIFPETKPIKVRLLLMKIWLKLPKSYCSDAERAKS